MKKASHKIEDGKMVKIKLDIEDETVKQAKLRGDFFLEPPEKLGRLETAIEGLSVDSTADELAAKLENVEADLIGFSRRDIGKAFKKAVKGEEK